VSGTYSIRPKADQDLDEQAFYLSTVGSPEVGHRFLLAAHETFTVLSSQPGMGWSVNLRFPELSSLRLFTIAGFDKMLVLYRPTANGIDVLRVIHGSRNLLLLLKREGVE
jgi:toxin ParE1/3/4